MRRRRFVLEMETLETGKEADDSQIKQLTQRLSRVGITNLQEPHLRYAINAIDSNGDPEKAFNLLVLFQQSLDGIVRDYNPDVKLLGAVNREGVTCYLDALLFAMFARLGSFEAMLYNTFDDEPRKRLAIVLRLWVNMLRTGKLITTDIVWTQAFNSDERRCADVSIDRPKSSRKLLLRAAGRRRLS